MMVMYLTNLQQDFIFICHTVSSTAFLAMILKETYHVLSHVSEANECSPCMIYSLMLYVFAFLFSFWERFLRTLRFSLLPREA